MDALIPEDTKKTVWTAFNKFCNAKTLDEMKLVFAQERSTLLSEVTELFLQYMIAHLLQSREQDNEEQLNNIRKIGSFFESMRLGYEYKAWREMEKFISKVKTATENIVLALDALTQADSEEEIHVILEREKALLLTEKAEQVLGYIIQQAEQSPEADDDSLQALRYILQLLQHARKVGIEQAIQNMVVIKDDEPTKEHEGTLFLLMRWLGMTSVRAKRRFLEEHPELLQLQSEAMLRQAIQSFQEEHPGISQSQSEAAFQQAIQKLLEQHPADVLQLQSEAVFQQAIQSFSGDERDLLSLKKI